MQEDPTPHTGADHVAAWGFSDDMLAYKAENPNIRFRGLNVGKQKNGNVLINAMHIFGINPLDSRSKSQAIAEGAAEIPSVLAYMRETIPGFEKVELEATFEELYVRESRHIYGEYRVSVNDILENTNFEDKIALGSYPIDIQATSMGNVGYVLGKPGIYSIPFRSLVPLEVEGLLVVGRGASYDSLPHGSIRVIPVGMGTGQAAGVAAAYSVNKDTSFREISKNTQGIKEVQETLVSQGAYLPDFEIPNPDSDHWAYDGLKFMRALGLATGGYENNYNLDQQINKEQLRNLLNNTLKRNGIDPREDFTIETGELLTTEDGANVIRAYLDLEAASSGIDLLEKEGVIDSVTARKLKEEEIITRGGIYMLLKDMVEILSPKVDLGKDA